ncbi:hypothetical protein S40285_00626 [Stachybotrys chlorohalonatus IBT 40285]|uniref:N-acetylglucosamine-induced protein 1 n=1 Tax=Stachybotrys chlorohalonatus (strain IBT 40285) TaxID=1283841 RepID=A0A084R2I2_STAC4|nr:hypothetical protein S40285_00626 [Stachybotrys chlorohalonata IBT 40285]
MGSAAALLPYWQVNVPEDERTAECPDFLVNLSEKDRGIIATPDSEYHVQTWDQVRDIVRSNQLERFQRWPSELRRYKAYTHGLARRYGSVASFVLTHRLGWDWPLEPKGAPFQHPEDYRILHNDWPYGIDSRIVHLVVWTKFALKEDPSTGDLTDHARAEIDAFVTTTFRRRAPQTQLLWFKNWSALKSVHAVEHFHVMLLDPDPAFIREITNGDVPQCAK